MIEILSKYIVYLSMLCYWGHYQNMGLDKITTWLPGADKVPSPSKVVSTSDWYLLNHLTGKLIHYDHVNDKFEPMLAESWMISGTTYTFKLRSDIRFSDGKTVTAADVAGSIRFLIAQRTSTHFPAWEYFHDCDGIRSFKDDCAAIKVVDAKTISLTLKERLQSFFLLLTSPEGGVWSQEDLARFERGEQPLAFSGPYSIDRRESDRLVLTSNSDFMSGKWFPDRPKEIYAYFNDLERIKSLMRTGQIDVYFEAGRPFAKHEYEPDTFRVAYSAPSTILYLFRVGKSKALVGRDFMTEMWKELNTPEMIPASSFLPFTSRRGIDEKAFLESLPKFGNNKDIKIAVLRPYFSEGLLSYLEMRARKVGYEISFFPLDSKKWFEAFNHLGQDEFDFILSAYVASERFPSVQLRYLLEGYKIPFDISALDNPDWSDESIELLSRVQKYILNDQIVIPLFFVKNQIRYSRSIDIGDQPIMDADIQIWRVNRSGDK